MKLIDRFEIVDDTFYAAVFDEASYKGVNEFRRLLSQWRDREFLFDYFERNIDKLQTPFWNEEINGDFNKKVEIIQAIDRTIDDATLFGKKMIELADGTLNGKNLDDVFFPLHKEIKHNRLDDEFKAYGIHRKSWLRFYAIKIESNQYFLAGGGIKLTKEMKDSEGLDIELSKLEKAYRFLTSP